MPRDTGWWKRSQREKTCQACSKKRRCFEYQREGDAPCGYNRLCEKCYERLVEGIYKQYITRRQFFPALISFILGLFIGGGVIYKYISHLNDFVYVVIVTERQRQILVEWALEKAENVSPQVIRDMVDTACESKFPYLVMAIIGAETLPKFDPGSMSNTKNGKRTKASCLGPMQVNPNVWTGELIEQGIISEEGDLFDPVLGVRAGIYIFEKELIKAKGNLRIATWSYVGLKYNKEDAIRYFECIQNYLGQIYLAVHTADKKGEGDDTQGTDN